MTGLNTGLLIRVSWKDGLSVFVTIIEQICDVQMTKRELKILSHGNFHPKLHLFQSFTSLGKRHTVTEEILFRLTDNWNWKSCMTSGWTNRCTAWLVNRYPDGSDFHFHILVHWGACSHLSHTQRPHDGYRTFCASVPLRWCFTGRPLCLSTWDCGSRWAWPHTRCSWSCCQTGSVLSCSSCSISLATLSQTCQHLWTANNRKMES